MNSNKKSKTNHLSEKDILEYFYRLEMGDKSVRDIIIESYINLVYYVIYHEKFKSNEDNFAAGLIGLGYAVDNYSIKKDVKFKSYAYPCIRGYILTYLKREGKQKENCLYLDSTIKGYDDFSYLSTIADKTDIQADQEQKANVKNLLRCLDSLSQKILIMKFGLNGPSYENDEIAEVLDINVSEVETILFKSLVTLKDNITLDPNREKYYTKFERDFNLKQERNKIVKFMFNHLEVIAFKLSLNNYIIDTQFYNSLSKNSQIVFNAYNNLDEAKKEIISYYFGIGRKALTSNEIAKLLGRSQSYVNKIISSILCDIFNQEKENLDLVPRDLSLYSTIITVLRTKAKIRIASVFLSEQNINCTFPILNCLTNIEKSIIEAYFGLDHIPKMCFNDLLVHFNLERQDCAKIIQQSLLKIYSELHKRNYLKTSLTQSKKEYIDNLFRNYGNIIKYLGFKIDSLEEKCELVEILMSMGDLYSQKNYNLLNKLQALLNNFEMSYFDKSSLICLLLESISCVKEQDPLYSFGLLVLDENENLLHILRTLIDDLNPAEQDFLARKYKIFNLKCYNNDLKKSSRLFQKTLLELADHFSDTNSLNSKFNQQASRNKIKDFLENLLDVSQSEDSSEVENVLACTNLLERQILINYYGFYGVGKKTFNEIACYLNCSVSSIKSSLNNSYIKIEEYLQSGSSSVFQDVTDDVYRIFKHYPKKLVDKVLFNLSYQDLKFLSSSDFLLLVHSDGLIDFNSKVYKRFYDIYSRIIVRFENYIPIKTIYQLFDEYSKEEVDSVIHSLNSEDKKLLFFAYGMDLNNPIRHPLWDDQIRSKFYYTVIDKMKRRLKNLHTSKIKTIYEILSDFTKEEVDYQISLLSREDKNILYLAYGKDLEHPIRSKKWDRTLTDALYNRIIPKLKRALIAANQPRTDNIKTIYDLLPEYTKEEIDQSISALDVYDRHLIFLAFGNDLNNPVRSKEWNKTLATRFYTTVLVKIKVRIENMRNPDRNKLKTIYELLNEFSPVEINYIISILGEEEQSLLLLAYGPDLNNPKRDSSWNSEIAKKFYKCVIEKIRTRLNRLRYCSQVTIYQLCDGIDPEIVDIAIDSLKDFDKQVVFSTAEIAPYMDSLYEQNLKLIDYYCNKVVPTIKKKTYHIQKSYDKNLLLKKAV